MVAGSRIPRRGGQAKIPAGRRAPRSYGKTSRQGDGRAAALISATPATPAGPAGPAGQVTIAADRPAAHRGSATPPTRTAATSGIRARSGTRTAAARCPGRPAMDRGWPTTLPGACTGLSQHSPTGVPEGSRRARSVPWPEDPRGGRGNDSPLGARLAPAAGQHPADHHDAAASKQSVTCHSRRLARQATRSQRNTGTPSVRRRAHHRRALIPPRRHGTLASGHA
jgi:hypothetical protein